VRILHISSARSFGGGERHLADLLNALAGRGHQVYAALAPRSPLREALSALPEKNIFTLTLRNALDLRSSLALAGLIREHRIEIAHAHRARDYPLAAIATRRAGGAHLVITRHVLFPLRQLHRIILSRASRVIAVSEAVAHALSAQGIFPTGKISIVTNGIDVRRFDVGANAASRETFRRRIGVEPKHLLVGMLGEINPLKGQEEFLRAAALIASRIADARFVIAGCDTSRAGAHLAQVERLVTELDLGERVHLTGWLDDVAPLFASLDILVSASHTESFGLTIAEAMASGVPVVATATMGAREIIEDGVTGMLVPVGDAESLASVVVRLLEDAPEERRRIGERALAAARERFSLDRMVDATERIYHEVLRTE
jgi:glycosyltransferase involved in cell wall biosynthesis